jgi:glycosyltransferase involved in cell wall biosynthesis
MTRNVLQQIPHEIIIVDDNSPDGTIQVANRLADVAVTKTREGQSKGLLYGMPRQEERIPKSAAKQRQPKNNLGFNQSSAIYPT